MKKRIITALILGFILIPAALVPALFEVFQVLLILFSLIAAAELVNMYDNEKKLSLPVKCVSIVLTFVLYCSIINSFEQCNDSLIIKMLALTNMDKFLSPIIVLISIFIILMSMLVFDKNLDAKDIGKLFMSIIYVSIGAGAFTVLRFFGVRFMVYVLIMAMITDIFALVFGLTMGKHKMAPHISPKKTWEGALGGTLVATIVGVLFLYFYPEISHFFHDEGDIDFFFNIFNYDIFTTHGKIIFVIMLSISLSICGQIGDLVASKLKRAYGIKDYSNIFPGHGGVMDRFDSTFFASAIFLIFMLIESNLFPFVL